MKGIDFKNAAIGLLLGVCVMLTLGVGGRGGAGGRGGIGGGGIADIGRYEVQAVGNSTSCFVIDSSTGRIWISRSNAQSDYLGSPQEWGKK